MALFDEDTGKLSIVKAEFLSEDTLSWEDLFAAYNKMWAITYSTSMDFIAKLLKHVDFAEIIFGCPAVMPIGVHEMVAYQIKNNEFLQEFKKNADKNKLNLMERIDSDSLKLFVAQKQLSHEKTYVLEAQDGRKRVITGSANLSNAAFFGIQRENICVFDDANAFDYYMRAFAKLKTDSTDRITAKSFVTTISESETPDILSLPVAETLKIKKAIPIIENMQVDDIETKFVLDVKNLAKNIAEAAPEHKKQGKTILEINSFKTLARHFVESISQKKDLKGEYPELLINIESQSISLNNKPLDLNPTKQEIEHDTRLFLEYMTGFDNFHGDIELVKASYFKLANWFFASPFMASLRYEAAINNKILLPYPVFGLLFGQSKAGKTSFLETLLKMMIGQKPKLSAPEFTRSSIEGLKHKVKGSPIIVDDIAKKRFDDHAVETIKHEEFGLTEKLLNYPAVIISANEDVKVVAPELVRRMVVFKVSMGLTNMEILRSGNIVPRVQKNIGTAFYREYLRRMLPITSEMLSELHLEDKTPPDILKSSSEILFAMFNEYGNGADSNFVSLLSLEDYFDEHVSAQSAIQQIKDAWNTDKKAFVCNKKRNELAYNAAMPFEARNIMKELPEYLEPRLSKEWVIMKLDKAQDFFKINFKSRRIFGFL